MKQVIKTTERTHLINIGNIIDKWKRAYGFIPYYLRIDGVVTVNIHALLNIECNSEFDDFKLREIKGIRALLYNKLHEYLRIHNIKKSLYITSSEKGITICFKEELTI